MTSADSRKYVRNPRWRNAAKETGRTGEVLESLTELPDFLKWARVDSRIHVRRAATKRQNRIAVERLLAMIVECIQAGTGIDVRPERWVGNGGWFYQPDIPRNSSVLRTQRKAPG